MIGADLPESLLDRASRDKWEVIPHEHLAAFWVRGNCMSPDGINDGDLVLADTRREPQHGDIGVFFIMRSHDKWDRVLKRLDLSDGISLTASNPAYAPVVIDDEKILLMVGTVIAFVHPVHS